MAVLRLVFISTDCLNYFCQPLWMLLLFKEVTKFAIFELNQAVFLLLTFSQVQTDIAPVNMLNVIKHCQKLKNCIAKAKRSHATNKGFV